MNIQIVREAGGIGDVVKATVVVRETQRQYPRANIYLYAPDVYKGLYLCATPNIHFVGIDFPEGRRSRKEPPDANVYQYLVPPKDKPDLCFDKVIDLYDPAFNYELECGKRVDKDRTELWCEANDIQPFCLTPRITIPSLSMGKAIHILEKKGVDFSKPLVGIQPFSTDPARDWPKEKFGALIERLEAEKTQPLIFDCVEGRPRDLGGIHIIGLDYVTLGGIIRLCNVLVGPDSGLNHLAAAVGTTGIALFASQNGYVTHKHYPNHIILQQIASCAPCYWARPSECLKQTLRKKGETCKILAQISVTQVMETIMNVLPPYKVPTL
jgi:ADP-heptose:LPS heptosyltransferase